MHRLPPFVTAAAAVAALTAGSVAAATDRLEIFRTAEVAPVALGADALLALPDLREHIADHGDVTVTGGEMRTVAGAAEAESATGLDVPAPASLPRGVHGDPVLRVGDPATATVTIAEGKLAGASLELAAGPGLVAVWPGGTGMPALMIGRATAPTAAASGASVGAIVDDLTSLPGMPDGVAASLRAIATDGSALPLPVPADAVATEQVTVGGAPATLLTARDASAIAVVWIDGGVVQVVGGTLDRDEVLAVAAGL